MPARPIRWVAFGDNAQVAVSHRDRADVDLEEAMRALRGLGVALIVCATLCVFLVVTMGATWTFAVAAAGVLGLAIVAVVGTRTGPEELLADAAWRAAVPDLPPNTDRLAMAATQVHIPGPEKTHGGKRGAQPGDAGRQGSTR
jgi:hypothetical protein